MRDSAQKLQEHENYSAIFSGEGDNETLIRSKDRFQIQSFQVTKLLGLHASISKINQLTRALEECTKNKFWYRSMTGSPPYSRLVSEMSEIGEEDLQDLVNSFKNYLEFTTEDVLQIKSLVNPLEPKKGAQN